MKAKDILSKALELEAAAIPDDAGMDNFERWDSLAHVRIIMILEEQLGRSLETPEIISIMDIESIEAVLKTPSAAI